MDVRFVLKKFAGQTPAMNHNFALTGTAEAGNKPRIFYFCPPFDHGYVTASCDYRTLF
jgi:hypothetical protein